MPAHRKPHQHSSDPGSSRADAPAGANGVDANGMTNGMTNGHLARNGMAPEDTTRGKLAKLIAEHPGLNIQELAESIGVTRTAALHGARGLIKDNTVATTRVGRHVLHFPRTMEPIERKALTVLRIESTRNILDVLFAEPLFTWTEISDKVMVSTRTVRRAMSRLEDDGLVELQKLRGRYDYRAFLHPELRVLLSRWKGPERGDLNLPKPKSVREWLWLLPDLLRSALTPV